MALPATLNGTQLYIKIGDGGDPTEEFDHPCLINAERGIAFRSSTNDIIVPDCANPDEPAWRQIVKDALNVGLTGAGKLESTQAVLDEYTAWWKGDIAKNVQVWIGTVGFWQGSFKLTEWSVTGNRNDKIEVEITLESDGIVADFATS